MSLKDLREHTTLCAYCPNLCLHACPASAASGSQAHSPWAKVSMVRWLGTDTGKRSDALEDITKETTEVLSQCTDCGACSRACRHEVDVSHILQQARQTLIDSGQAAYAADMFAPPAPNSDEEPQPSGVSGHRLLAAGYTAEFQSWARQIAHAVPQRLVVTSLEDFRCITQSWPAYGVRYSGAVEIIRCEPTRKEKGDNPVWLKPCHLRKDGAIFEGLQSSAEATAQCMQSIQAEDDPGICCGAGGVYPVVSAAYADRAAWRVFDRANAVGASSVITACGGCAAHLNQARRAGDPRVFQTTVAPGETR